MLLSDIIEEILEKVGDGPGRTLSMRSLVRKVDLLQKTILRQYGNNTDDVAVLDILEGVAEYPLPCAPGNITSVYVNDYRIPFRQRNDYTLNDYYYLLDGTIGLYLFGRLYPKTTHEMGLKIFHKHVPATLSETAFDAVPDLEETYHMLLVYGVLIDTAETNLVSKYKSDYNEMLAEFVHSTRDPESTSITEVFRL